MNQSGPQFTHTLPKTGVQLQAMTRRFVQRHKLHICALNALGKVGVDFGQRHHRMPVRRRRHVVDEVDDAVFQASGVKPKDHMRNQRARIRQNSLRHFKRWRWFAMKAGSQTPDTVTSVLQCRGAEGGLDVDEGAAFHQFFAKVFD